MSQELPVLWSPAQQAWLQAMGYTVYHDGQLAAELDAALRGAKPGQTLMLLVNRRGNAAFVAVEVPAAD